MFIFLQMLETAEEKLKFEELYMRYRGSMYAVAWKILKNEQDAEDVVQEAFRAIIEHFEKINDISCHKTWNYIVTIVKNKSFTLYKQKEKRNLSVYEDWKETEDGCKTEEDAVQKETADILAEIMRTLPYPYKEVLYLQYYNGESGETIAALLNKTPENVRKISQRARQMLKRELEKRGIHDA